VGPCQGIPEGKGKAKKLAMNNVNCLLLSNQLQKQRHPKKKNKQQQQQTATGCVTVD